MKNKEKFEELKILVLNKIQNANKIFPIKQKILCQDFNLTPRILKQIITSLREEYPIVSKETNGGGYWMATTSEEIIQFINMIGARKKGYEQTIQKMAKFI